MKEAGDIGHAELMCALDQYEYLGVLWANTVPMVSPGKDTAIFSEICGIILTTLPSRHPTRPAAAILGRECNICAALAIPTRVLRSPQARIAVAHQHASSGRRAARPALRERRRSPRAGPLWDRRRGREGADSAPQGQRGRF